MSCFSILSEFSHNCIRPEHELPDNKLFNERVSAIRVRSEHAIGYLKGRFSSLKHLRISIREKKHVQFMVGWITAAICVHNFALEHEDVTDFDSDQFFYDCQSSRAWDRGGNSILTQRSRTEELNRGRAKREILKNALLNVD